MKAMIICAAGMSSSMIAKKLSEHFVQEEKAIEVNARGIMSVDDLIDANEVDVYLVSPQTSAHFDTIQTKAAQVGKQVFQIPRHLYSPTSKAVQSLGQWIAENINYDA